MPMSTRATWSFPHSEQVFIRESMARTSDIRRVVPTAGNRRRHTMPTQIVRTSVVSASANRCKFSGTTTRVPSLRYRSRRISSITDSTR